MTDIEIKNNNPWSNIRLDLLYDSSYKYVCEGDEEQIKVFNKNVDDKNRLITNIPPEPWQGNPLKAKVIFLSLNPGYIDEVNHKLAKIMQNDKQLLIRIMDFKRQTLDLTSNSFLPEQNDEEPIGTKDAISMLGDWYWEKGFRELRKKVCDDNYTEANFYRDVAIVQYHAYASEKFEKVFPRKEKLLKSQEFTKQMIQHIRFSNPNTLFVVMRAKAKWQNFLGETLYNKLNIIEKESKSMSQAISPANIGDSSFYKICKTLNPKCKISQ